MLKLAVFDLDGTILRGWSAETRLVFYLVRRGVITPYQWIQYGAAAVRFLGKGFVKSFQGNKYYLRGISVNKLERLLPGFCNNYLRANFQQVVTDRLGELKREEFHTVLLSGTLMPILVELRHILDVDDIIGAELEISDGFFTGRLARPRPCGKEKINALVRHFAGEQIDYSSSYAFADHTSDLPLMERFGHPVAVRPGSRLCAVARERGWEILE